MFATYFSKLHDIGIKRKHLEYFVRKILILHDVG